MLVVAVGERSVWGSISASLNAERDETPLQKKLDKMADVIGQCANIEPFPTEGNRAACIWEAWACRGRGMCRAEKPNDSAFVETDGFPWPRVALLWSGVKNLHSMLPRAIFQAREACLSPSCCSAC